MPRNSFGPAISFRFRLARSSPVADLRRGLTNAAGDNFAVTASEQISGRLDTKAVKDFLGESYCRFEVAIVSTVIRIKAVRQVDNAPRSAHLPTDCRAERSDP